VSVLPKQLLRKRFAYLFFPSRSRLCVFLLFVALLLLSASAAVWAKPFAVASFSPTGEVNGPAEIRAVFGAPVVKSEDVGRDLASDDLPLVFTPRLPGNGKWLNALTFIYQPSSGYLPEATEYRARIRDGLKDLSGARISGKLEYRFHTPALRLLGARQVDFSVRDDYADYELNFSVPVDPARLRGYTEVRDGSGVFVQHSYVGTMVTRSPRLRVSAGDGSPVVLRVEAGMPPRFGTLGLEERVSLELSRDLSLKITNAYARGEHDGCFLYIETSSPVDIDKAASFFEIDPPMRLTLESWGSALRVAGGFKPRDRVRLDVRKGLPALEGDALADAWSRAFIIPDLEPYISFTTQGHFISPLGGPLTLPISTVNIDRLDVGVERVYDNNVPYVMRNMWPYSVYDLSERVFQRRYELSSSPNEILRSSIDLGKILNGGKGLFEVYANRADSWPRISRIVNVTDLGASAKVFERGVLVWVNSISLGKPAANVSVRVYSASNQLLESGRTDRNGVWKTVRNAAWDPNLRPDMIVVSKEDDTSVLRLENNIWNRGAPEYAGSRYAPGAYFGMCFTPRGVFRPGERVPIDMIVRDRSLELKTPFPVQVKIRTSMGREWETKTAELSNMGMASVETILSEAAPTGQWSAGVFIPGESEPIAETRFLVEDFAPPRIDVEVSGDKKEIVGEAKGMLFLAASYLFGAAGSDLPYEVDAAFIPREYSHPDWRYYRFGDERGRVAPDALTIANGTLSPDGTASVPFLHEPPFPAILDLSLRVGVMEDSGRWAYRSLLIPYYPADTLLGILLPRGTLTSGTETAFGFAAVKTDGTPAPNPSAAYTIYKKLANVVMIEQDGVAAGERAFRYEPLDGHENVSVRFAAGKAEVRAAIPAGGEYLIELTGKNGETTAAASFYVYDASWNYGESEAVLPDSLTITLDKPVYKAGEKARGKVTGAFAGTLLVSVETDSVLRHEVLSAGKDGAAFSFDVTKEMAPNAWITAQLIRPVEPDEDWRAHRAFGAVPLPLDNSEKSLTVEVQAPQKLYAEKENDVSIQIKDHQGRGVEGEISVMLVDDGVLELTRFETPDFYQRYAARRGLTIDVFDIYRDLIRLYTKYPAPLSPGGGMAEDAANLKTLRSLSPVRAERFHVLTVCDRVKTDKNGVANLSIELPEFTGRARLMAVAAAKSAFGAAEARYEIADDIIADLTLPRVLAPGDVFDSEIRIFNKTSEDIGVSLDLSVKGSLELAGGGSARSYGASLAVPRDSNSTVIPLKWRAGAEAGVAEISLRAQYEGGEISKTTQIAVRPPYPRMTRSTALSIPAGGTERVDLSGDWFPGTRRGVLAVSALPRISVADLAKFLSGYPYECLEQTISSAWAALAMPDLVASFDPMLATKEQLAESLDAKIRRVRAQQLYNGAFAFWPGSQSSDWATAYAVHFLLACEARSVPVPADTIETAYEYLRQILTLPPSSRSETLYGAELATRAYISYIMAIRGDAPLSWMAYLRDNARHIPAYGRLLLAAAYARSGQKELARSMLGENVPPIDHEPARQEMPNWDSPLRGLAIYLLAWNEIDPTSPEAALAAENLLAALRASGVYTTQEASFALSSLAVFYSYHERGGESKIIVKDERGSALIEQIDNNNYEITVSDDVKSFSIYNEGSAAGYVAAVFDGVPAAPPRPLDRGISVSVEYRDASSALLSPDAAIPRGERVTAEITLVPLSAAVKNIVVVLPLAGGFEIENPRLMDARSEEYFDDDSEAPGARAELRDDRLVLFVDELSKPFKWRCSMRAVTAGRFQLPPIAAEGMYAPGIQSAGASSFVTIVAR
jgi:uncharacterized protein YfaS (alpha-2-macroglobulin family)